MAIVYVKKQTRQEIDDFITRNPSVNKAGLIDTAIKEYIKKGV
jgi:hypothetical protein